MTIDITTMPHAVSNSNPSGNWTLAFYEAQLQIWANGGGTIYFPAGDYVFNQTLQVFMVGGIIRGEHAQTTTITIQPLSTDSLDGRYRDGIIVHNAATAQLQAAGFDYSYPIPVDIPSISPGGAGTPTQPLIAATTGDGIVIENISLQYDPTNANNFIAGFGHGIVLHRGTCCIRDCVVSGFNADGIHINAIVYGSNVIQNWFQDPNIPSPGDPNLGLNYAYSNDTNYFGVYANIPIGSNVPQFNHFDINPTTLNIVQAANEYYVPAGSALSVQFGNYVNIGNVPTFIEEAQMTSLMAAGLITVTVTPTADDAGNILTVTVSIDINYSSLVSFDGLIGQQYVMQIFATINGQLVPLTIIHPYQGYAITPRIVVVNYASNYPSVYTNANLTQVYNTTVQNCGRHGIFTWDNDANACTFVNVLAINNQGWGIFETSWLGNTYTACRSYNNATGDYFALAMDGGVNTSVFVDCQTANTPQPTILVCLRAQNWMGGSSNHYTPLDTIPNIAPLAQPESNLNLQSSKIQRNGTLTPFTFLNNIPPLKTNQTDYDTKARVQFTPGGSNDLSLMSFSAYHLDTPPPDEYDDRANWDLRFLLDNPKMKSYSFVGNSAGDRHPLQLSSILTHINAHNMGVDAIPRPLPLSNIFLNKPFIVGNIQADDLLKNQVWVADAKPSGNLDGYEVGDIVLNINPNLSLSPNGEPMYPDLWFASWICVAIPYDPYKIFKGMERIFALILFFSLFTETKCIAQDTWVKTYHLNTFSSYNLSKNEGGYNILASFGSEGAMVFQTDENGDSLYYNTYQFAGNNTGQYLGGFIKTYDDGHLIFGTSLPGYRISALKTNADESIAWNKALFCGNDTLKGRCVDAINLPDNNVLVTGYSGCNTGGTAFDLFLAKLNIITGNIIWQHIYNTATYDIGGGQVGYHSLDAVKVLPLVDGYLIVGDYNVNANGTSAYLIKTNFEGVFQWDKYINGTYYVNDAILDTDGNILLTGGGLVTYLVKLNPQVDTIWLKTYYDNTLPAPNKMVAVNNGYIMAGGNGGYAFALKTDTAGNVIWIRSYQNASYIYDVIIEEDGDLVMLGLNDDDYTTVLIKTDSTGYYQGLGTHSTTTVPIKVYPNPAANTLSINHQNLPTAQTVELYNLTGQLVLQQNLQQNNTTISVAGLQVGVYMLQIKAGNTLAQQKVVVWR